MCSPNCVCRWCWFHLLQQWQLVELFLFFTTRFHILLSARRRIVSVIPWSLCPHKMIPSCPQSSLHRWLTVRDHPDVSSVLRAIVLCKAAVCAFTFSRMFQSTGLCISTVHPAWLPFLIVLTRPHCFSCPSKCVLSPILFQQVCSIAVRWNSRTNHPGNARIQDDQRVSVHLMITVKKTRKNIVNGFNHHVNVVRIRVNRWR
jgi:hypothetical protein